MTPYDLQQFYNFTGKTLVITGGTDVLGSEMVAVVAVDGGFSAYSGV